MFQINKIRAQIKLLENQKLKLTSYLQETEKNNPRDSQRIKDIQRALKRVNDNLAHWEQRVNNFENAPQDPKPRPRRTQDLGGPLI